MPLRPAALATITVTGLIALAAPAVTAQATAGQHSPVVVANRGASAYAPENTLAAADRLGIAWVENNVQRTKDGELVVLHDTSLARTTNVKKVFPDRSSWNVGDFTLREIEKLDAGSWFGAKFKGERVPTLEEYLEEVEDNGQKLLLDLNNPELYPGIERQALRELRHDGWLDRGHLKRRLIIQSFNADAIKKVHRLNPAIKTGFLGNPTVAELPKYAAFADQINPQYESTTADYVSAVHALKGPHGRRMTVYTWTVDDGPTAVKATRAGVDGIISNKPDVVRDAL
ncbi:glycerophosphodiester phosphodiesterase [Streptomyces sp. CG1]|uniref:glycerophosphodiester phosphodiesterase n=1 Tax=Streptomyces sp. CG1 TaxID=1287523 RepID=UPI0034E264E4